MLHELVHHCFECFDTFDLLACFVHAWLIIGPNWLTMVLSLSTLLIFEVSRRVKFAKASLKNSFSWSLPGVITSLVSGMISSQIGMSTVNGAWLEDSHKSGWMECQSNSLELHLRNIKSMTELDSLTVSENLVGLGLMGDNSAKSSESAIIIRSSLIEEWCEKRESHKLSLMLKSPVIKRTWLILTSVSLRYFKAEWDESE